LQKKQVKLSTRPVEKSKAFSRVFGQKKETAKGDTP